MVRHWSTKDRSSWPAEAAAMSNSSDGGGGNGANGGGTGGGEWRQQRRLRCAPATLFPNIPAAGSKAGLARNTLHSARRAGPVPLAPGSFERRAAPREGAAAQSTPGGPRRPAAAQKAPKARPPSIEQWRAPRHRGTPGRLSRTTTAMAWPPSTASSRALRGRYRAGLRIRNISLTSNPEQIEGRVNGVKIVLLTCF